jgi:hypothetical protein
MAAKNKGKNEHAALATVLIAGIQKHFANVTTITFAGRTMTPAQLTSELQTLVNLRNDVIAAQVAAKAKLATEASQAPAIDATMVAFVDFVRGMFAGQPDALADFGQKPKKARTPMTAEQQAAANAKRKSTLEARGIVGSKKRKAVKGAVTGVQVTPVVSEPQHQQATPAPVQPTAGSATPRNGGPQG